MQVKKIREYNIRKLIAEKFDDDRSAFCSAAGINRSYLNNCLIRSGSSKGSFGDNVCRKMEEKLEMEPGELDSSTNIILTRLDEKIANAIELTLGVLGEDAYKLTPEELTKHILKTLEVDLNKEIHEEVEQLLSA